MQYRITGAEGFATTGVTVAALPTLSATIVDLIPGAVYEVRVAAVNDAGAGVFSTPISTVTEAAADGLVLLAPAAPPMVAVAPTVGVIDGLTVTWGAPAGVSPDAVNGYIVQYRAAADGGAFFSTGAVVNPDLSRRTATIAGLMLGAVYEVRVATATIDGGVGVFSTPVSATVGTVVPDSAPGAPIIESVEPVSTPASAQRASLAVTWTLSAEDSANVYVLQYRDRRHTGNYDSVQVIGGGSLNAIGSREVDTTTAVVSDLEFGDSVPGAGAGRQLHKLRRLLAGGHRHHAGSADALPAFAADET